MFETPKRITIKNLADAKRISSAIKEEDLFLDFTFDDYPNLKRGTTTVWYKDGEWKLERHGNNWRDDGPSIISDMVRYLYRSRKDINKKNLRGDNDASLNFRDGGKYLGFGIVEI